MRFKRIPGRRSHSFGRGSSVLIGKLKRRFREQANPLGSHPVSDVGAHPSGPGGTRDRDESCKGRGGAAPVDGRNGITLEQAGLVTGSPDPADGRQTILSLTATCRDWIKETRAAQEDWLFRAIQANSRRKSRTSSPAPSNFSNGSPISKKEHLTADDPRP